MWWLQDTLAFFIFCITTSNLTYFHDLLPTITVPRSLYIPIIAPVMCNDVMLCFLPRSNNQSFHLPLAWRSPVWSAWSPLHCEPQQQPRAPAEPELCGHLWSPGPPALSKGDTWPHRLAAALPLCRQVPKVQPELSCVHTAAVLKTLILMPSSLL